MSMKTKKNRWAGIALAALVVAGGTVAVPQAASASSSNVTCSNWATSCSTSVTASGSVKVRASANTPNGWYRFTVKTSSGRTLCDRSLQLNQSYTSCSLGSYSGRVNVRVDKPWGSSMRLYATS